MRVLLVNKFYAPRGGAERCVFDQLRWLQAAGHETHVFSQLGADNEPCADDSWFVDEVHFGSDRSPSLLGVGRFFWSEHVRRRLTALVERHRPELAILHNIYHHLGPAVPVTLSRLGVPSVMILHDHKVACPAYSAWRAEGPCSDCRGQRFYHAALKACGGSRLRGAMLSAESYFQWRALGSYGRIQRFIAPSAYLQQILPEMGFPFPIERLPNAVEVARQPQVALALRQHVGFAGRLSPEKGVDVLVRAAARLPAISFRIAGDGPERGELQKLARECCATNVAFIGRLESSELEREAGSWRLAIVPSRSPENFPYAALDAMNQGVPVIASSIGGLPEMLTGRGQLVEPGNVAALAQAIAALYPDLHRLESLAALARAFVEAECRPETYLARLLGGTDVRHDLAR